MPFVLSLLLAALLQDPGDLFDRVVDVLEGHYYDVDYREDRLPGLADQYRDAARASVSLDEEREVVFEFLGRIPASHLGLVSEAGINRMMGALAGREMPTAGFQLVRHSEGYFAAGLLEGGPAVRAGLLAGDRIVTIDGVPPEDSPRLDWRTDDAALPDPPVHALLVGPDETISLRVERTRGAFADVEIETAIYTALDAAEASVRTIEHDGFEIGYLHFWYIHFHTIDEILARAMNRHLREDDALIIDLRGRGGSATMVPRLVSLLARDKERRNRPIIAIIDAGTRSAKEAIAYELRERGLARLVGTRTAGALLPMGAQPVGQGAVLVYPVMSLGEWTERVEGRGVEPHVRAKPLGPYAEGRDSLLEAALDEAVREILRGVR